MSNALLQAIDPAGSLLELLDELDGAVETCESTEIPLIVGRLETAKHRALAKVIARPKAADDDDDIMTIPEVAKDLRRSDETVYEMCRRGELPTVHTSKRGVGVRRGSLKAWKRKRERRIVGSS